MRSRSLPALLAALAAAPSAAAQAPSLRDTIALDTLVVTAARGHLAASRVGFAVTVLTPERLEAEGAVYAADAVRAVPGATVDLAVGPGGPAIVRLRGGEEVFTQVLVDGVQLNSNGGYFDFQGVAFGNLERVEVARGPQSALLGSSAMSGAVQFLTRRGRPGSAAARFGWETGVASGPGAAYRGTADVSGGSRAVQYSAGAGLAYDRGYLRLPHDVRSRDGSLRVDADAGSGWSLTGTARLASVDGRLPVRDAGATRAPLDPTARNSRDRLAGAVTARRGAAGGVSHQLRASAYREGFVYHDEADGVGGGYPFFVFDANFVYRSELWRTGAEYAATWEAPAAEGVPAPAALTAGVLWEREDLHARTSGDFGDGALRRDRASGAAFAEARVELGPRLSVLAGARAERYQGLPTELTPRASAALAAVPGRLTLRAAWGRGYKAPNLQEQFPDNPFIVSNPDLRPERSTGYEAGATLWSADRRASLALTAFHQEFTDLLRTAPAPDGERSILRNLGRSRARGVEWALRWEPDGAWAVGSEGGWTETEVRDNRGLDPAAFPLGEALPGRPEVVAGAYLELRPDERWSGTVRGRWVGRQVAFTERFSGQRVELDPFGVVGVGVRYAASARWSVYGRVENALDHRHQVAFDRPGAPLVATLGMRLD
jgi:vitamin B12 transporter